MTTDKTHEPLSSWLAAILLHGAPSPHPGDPVSIHDFGEYIRDLAEWTNTCRTTIMGLQGIKDEDWTGDENRHARLEFDQGFIPWAYTLKEEDYE